MFRFFFFLIAVYKLVSGYHVVLSGDGDIIHGETAQFKAEVFEEKGDLSTTEFKFEWSDNAIPQHSSSFTTKPPAIWNVTYDSDFHELYKVTVTVKVYKIYILVPSTVGTATKTFDVVNIIKGDIILSQGNYTRKKFVSNSEPVHHQIQLKKPYLDFLNKSKNFMRTFWFVDCAYYGQINGFSFDFNYTKTEVVHHVEAILVATYIPSLPKNPELLSYRSEKIVEKLNTTNVTFNISPNINSSLTANYTQYEDIDDKLKSWLINFNQSKLINISGSSDYCINSSMIPIISNYTYGFFRTNLTVKSPVKISPINGTNWLMDGEVLNISVSCNGSSPYTFCVLLKSGLYNVTGNEVCKEEKMIRNCSFGIQHLFKEPSEYTLVVIISNAVSRVVKPIAVNIYKVKKHAQLSVIIVPVTFSLIATIIIIFGVAYYVQSKHKYTIEVADFDFGNQTSGMEYKTFHERLRESISNSFMKSQDYQDSDSWPESVPTSRKYGSMQ